MTIVTAYVELPKIEGEWDRTRETYLEWMRSVLSIKQYMVIYVEEANVSFVKLHRRHVMPYTKIISVDVDRMMASDDYANIKRIIDGRFMSHARRNDRIELKVPLYNKIMFSKIDFVQEVLASNPFQTDYFFWMDAGFAHGLHKRLQYKRVIGRPWPNPEKNDLMKDTILAVQTRDLSRSREIEGIFVHHDAMLSGNIWGGDRNRMLDFCSEFKKEVRWSFERNLMDDDQAIMTAVYIKHPEMFSLVDCSSSWRDRCYMLKYLDGK